MVAVMFDPFFVPLMEPKPTRPDVLTSAVPVIVEPVCRNSIFALAGARRRVWPVDAIARPRDADV